MREDLRPAPALPVSAHDELAPIDHRRRRACPCVAMIVASFAGHPLLGVFGLVGLALGALNNRLLQLSVLRYALTRSSRTQAMTKKRLPRGVMVRLGAITLLAFGFALLVRPDGLRRLRRPRGLPGADARRRRPPGLP